MLFDSVGLYINDVMHMSARSHSSKYKDIELRSVTDDKSQRRHIVNSLCQALRPKCL